MDEKEDHKYKLARRETEREAERAFLLSVLHCVTSIQKITSLAPPPIAYLIGMLEWCVILLNPI